MPGWLDPMLALLRARPDAGMVGAKLLFPDGSLQEAGGIIWRDASGWNFGRHEDPSHAVYNYVREVDYCSGAALLIERDLFVRLGGFDERYAPAYFEEPDLSFRLRQIGLKTLYQPASRVVHFEGVSHGRDETVGIKACQVVNRRRFIDTWEPALAAEQYPVASTCCGPAIAPGIARSFLWSIISFRSRTVTPGPAPSMVSSAPCSTPAWW